MEGLLAAGLEGDADVDQQAHNQDPPNPIQQTADSRCERPTKHEQDHDDRRSDHRNLSRAVQRYLSSVRPSAGNQLRSLPS